MFANLLRQLTNGMINAVKSIFNTSTKSTMGGPQGIALDRFNSIMDAHCDNEDIIEENELIYPECPYPSPDGYENCYEQALEELIEEFEALAAELGVDPEDLITEEMILGRAYLIAQELVAGWLEGDIWIPEEVLDWAWYEVSDHNW